MDHPKRFLGSGQEKLLKDFKGSALWRVCDWPGWQAPEFRAPLVTTNLSTPEVSVELARDDAALSHAASPLADSSFRSSSGVSLRNSQKVRAGKFRPSRP